jgi:hypothetical protein
MKLRIVAVRVALAHILTLSLGAASQRAVAATGLAQRSAPRRSLHYPLINLQDSLRRHYNPDCPDFIYRDHPSEADLAARTSESLEKLAAYGARVDAAAAANGGVLYGEDSELPRRIDVIRGCSFLRNYAYQLFLNSIFLQHWDFRLANEFIVSWRTFNPRHHLASLADLASVGAIAPRFIELLVLKMRTRMAEVAHSQDRIVEALMEGSLDQVSFDQAILESVRLQEDLEGYTRAALKSTEMANDVVRAKAIDFPALLGIFANLGDRLNSELKDANPANVTTESEIIVLKYVLAAGGMIARLHSSQNGARASALRLIGGLARRWALPAPSSAPALSTAKPSAMTTSDRERQLWAQFFEHADQGTGEVCRLKLLGEFEPVVEGLGRFLTN